VGEPGSDIDFDDWGLPDLCTRCLDDGDCGGNNDRCLDLPGLDGYCGMDCKSDANCPVDYECNMDQCTPVSLSCDDLDGDSVPEPPGSEEAREYVLGVINDNRSQQELQPLRRNECLDGIAAEALDEWESTWTPGSKFQRECLESTTACQCDWAAEAQGSVSLEDRTWEQALEHPFSRVEESDPFNEVLEPAWESVGIAVDFEGTYVLISVEFAP
jgi:hypothetical protein